MNLIIVESPSKAKTISKYLGKDWTVVASVGHIRDLIPKNNSIDVNNNFEMKWQIIPGKEKQLKLIEDKIKKVDNIYLASDPDREGEAIAWHILEILKTKKILENKKIFRIVFYEVTKKAILKALENPREINLQLVDSYIVRRALDYLIGFNISPLLWYKNIGKSAGRVQSVAVKLVVEKEKEIEQFKPEEYWSIEAECSKNNIKFNSKLSVFKELKIQKMTISNIDTVNNILSLIKTPTKGIITNIKQKQISRKPLPPFTTSTLQQTSVKQLYFSPKKTMMIAQKLYEQGFITYMRTDSTNLSEDFIKETRLYIEKTYGKDFIPKNPNIYITKSKNAQEAHEAIRPTKIDNNIENITEEELKLYKLILNRTLACQMSNAEFSNINIEIKESNSIFSSSGTTRIFEGYQKIYINPEEENEENNLPILKIGDEIIIEKIKSNQHFTQPPAHYNEATLIKKLEELGIGRPSTYASIISTIIDRKYIFQNKNRVLNATDSGWVLTSYLSKYFKDLIDIDFTAKTEDKLDDILNGKLSKINTLKEFWDFISIMINDSKNIEKSNIIEEINSYMKNHIFKDKDDKCPKCGKKLNIKLSKYGPFIGCSNYPNCDFIDNSKNEIKDKNSDIDLGENILFKIGRFGAYITDGKVKIPAKNYTSETITLDIAKDILKNKNKLKEIGINSENNEIIYYHPIGKYGSYISCKKINISVKKEPTLEEAIKLLKKKNVK